jgi:hypothetical protein
MNEELDLDYINNYGIDEFNAELLLNPAEVANNKFLRLAEAEKPDLPMLCPLAKALYYLGRPEFREHAREALRSVRVIDPNRSANPTSESVHHVIKRVYGEHEVCLEFRSKSTFIWASEEDESDDIEMQIGTLADCKFSEEVTQESLIKELSHVADDGVSTPMGEPVDDGPFVCSLSYRLCSINGLPLKQVPAIECSADDLEFIIPNSGRNISFPDCDSEEFEWSDLLSNKDKEMLLKQMPFLASLLDTASSPARKFKILTVDEIQRSYSSGDIEKKAPSRLKVVIGCGAGWQPELDNDDAEGNDEGGDDISFPLIHPPLIEFNLPLRSKSRREEFDSAFPALKILLDAVLALE